MNCDLCLKEITTSYPYGHLNLCLPCLQEYMIEYDKIRGTIIEKFDKADLQNEIKKLEQRYQEMNRIKLAILIITGCTLIMAISAVILLK